MEDLDALDREIGGPMRVRHRGHIVVLPAASEVTWQTTVTSAVSTSMFGRQIWPLKTRISYIDLRSVQNAWRIHNALPTGPQCQRLIYMMQRYGSGIEFDLRNHLSVSATELFRGRRWREMLNYIDMLPTNSHMNRLLMADEQYMEMVVEQQEKSPPGASRPSMADFSLTNNLLMQLVDAVHVNTAVNRGIANPKGPRPRIDPLPRPYSAADKVRANLQKKQHEEMVSILLPKR